MTYRINEIFYSLQGEGANSGKPAVFVRFSGCNLDCDFCDTDTSKYKVLSINDIMDLIVQFPSRFIILTGGEPTLQLDDVLIQTLHNNGWTIALETNGTHPLPAFIDWVTISPKETGQLVVHQADEVKIVYVGQDVERYQQLIRATCYYLQPCYRQTTGGLTDNRNEVIDYCLKHPQWSLSTQLHKTLNIR